MHFGIDACLLVIALALLHAGFPLEIAGLNLPAGDLANTVTWANRCVQGMLICAAVIEIGDAIHEARFLLRGSRVKPGAIVTT